MGFYKRVVRYSRRARDSVLGYIEKHCGKPEGFFRENESSYVKAEIAVVPPSPRRNFYTLVTVGMGAREMKIPHDLEEHRLSRAELVVRLPASWNLSEEGQRDPRWNWPIRLMRFCVRLPFEDRSWIGWGHSVENGTLFSADTGFMSAMLVNASLKPCPVGRSAVVNFYELVPLYVEELEYKIVKGAQALLKRMRGVSPVVDTARHNVCDGTELPMEDAAWHLDTIRLKGLKTDFTNAYNHLAAFYLWALGKGFVRQGFVSPQRDAFGVREFVHYALGGKLYLSQFTDAGKSFCNYYYGPSAYLNDTPYFPADVDDYAREIFGDRFDSKEFNDEAYLFLPYCERYVTDVMGIVEMRYREWMYARETGSAARELRGARKSGGRL